MRDVNNFDALEGIPEGDNIEGERADVAMSMDRVIDKFSVENMQAIVFIGSMMFGMHGPVKIIGGMTGPTEETLIPAVILITRHDAFALTPQMAREIVETMEDVTDKDVRQVCQHVLDCADYVTNNIA